MNLTRAITGFLLSFVFLVFFAYMVSGVKQIFQSPLPVVAGSADISAPLSNPQPVEITPMTIPIAPQINSESAISVESNLSGSDKILFNKNNLEKLPIASLTKLMTAVIILDNPSVYNFSDDITVDSAADSQDALNHDVKLGDTFSVENFFDIMLIESSNRSAYTLSEKMGEPQFVNLMNKKAKQIGLENTFFADPTGLSFQNVSTSDDLIKLAEYILKNYPEIAETTKIKDFYVPKFGDITNTDELLGQVPEIVCGKTGFTDQAKGCLLLVTNNPKNNDYIINVILGADDRFAEMRKLLDWQDKVCG